MAKIYSEEDLLNWIIGTRGLATMLGWKSLHIRPARAIKHGEETYRTPVSGDGEGFPDLLLARPPRLLLAEIKREDGKPSPQQSDWLDVLSRITNPPETFLWKPSDLDEIEEVLKW
uniref:Putative VRR-NUC domain-containing protein n=2 Tax=viral metagenome TaxID=1070528 RepID=A0A6M3KP81_9ZZZZ